MAEYASRATRRRRKSRSRYQHWHGGNDLTEFGKEYFESNYRNYEAQSSSRKLDHYLSQITKRASGCDRFLDIGCGLGIWADFVATRRPEWEVTAVDVDTDIIEHNRRRSPNVRFQVGRADRIPGEGTFDVVTAMDVLEHVPHVGAALKRIVKRTASGGLVVFVVPVYDGPLGPLVHLLDRDPTHLHKWGREKWLDTARNHLAEVEWHGLFRLLLPTSHYIHFSSTLLRSISPAILVSGRVE